MVLENYSVTFYLYDKTVIFFFVCSFAVVRPSVPGQQTVVIGRFGTVRGGNFTQEASEIHSSRPLPRVSSGIHFHRDSPRPEEDRRGARQTGRAHRRLARQRRSPQEISRESISRLWTNLQTRSSLSITVMHCAFLVQLLPGSREFLEKSLRHADPETTRRRNPPVPGARELWPYPFFFNPAVYLAYNVSDNSRNRVFGRSWHLGPS